MSLSIGIVGLPNVGKSTLFQAFTKKEVNISNYPFATIDPNVGIVEVPDERLPKLKKITGSAKAVPAIVEFVDIAGLVKGAHKGEGLGNQFLSHIREVDLILEVVRVFQKEDVSHIEKTIDPLRDIETIKTELALKDIETLEKTLSNAEKAAKSGDKKSLLRLNILKNLHTRISQNHLETGFPNEEKIIAKELGLLSAKPILYLINGNPKLVNTANFPAPNVVIDVKEELDLSELSEEEKRELNAVPRLPFLIKKTYELLGLLTFFTANENEAKAWSVEKGAKAKKAAGIVHSDFEEKFIRALVINIDELFKLCAWSKAKEQGKIRTEGKDYLVREGDVIEFKI